MDHQSGSFLIDHLWGDTIDLGDLLWELNKIKENTCNKIPKAHRTLVVKDIVEKRNPHFFFG